MPRKRRSAAQKRQSELMRETRWANPEEAEKITEVYRCMTIEEYKARMQKSERQVEKAHGELRNAERRVRKIPSSSPPVVDTNTPFGKQFTRMAEKVEAAGKEMGELEDELDQAKEQLEAVKADREHWKEKTKEIHRAIRRLKAKEFRGPKGIYKAARHAITYLVYTGGRPLSIPDYRIEGRVFELVNELAFTWRVPIPMIEGIVGTVSQATVDVCFGGDIDDVDIEMGEHYRFDEHEHRGSPVRDDAVAGPSGAVVSPDPDEAAVEETA